MIADVGLVESIPNGRHHRRMAVPEVVGATVAVAIEPGSAVECVEETNTPATAHDGIESVSLVRIDLARIEIATSEIEDRPAAVRHRRRCYTSEIGRLVARSDRDQGLRHPDDPVVVVGRSKEAVDRHGRIRSHATADSPFDVIRRSMLPLTAAPSAVAQECPPIAAHRQKVGIGAATSTSPFGPRTSTRGTPGTCKPRSKRRLP